MMQPLIPNQETDNNYTAGQGSIIIGAIAALLMIAATALFMPSLNPDEEFGFCLTLPGNLLSPPVECAINAVLIFFAILFAFIINKKHSFVKSTEPILPTAMAVILASNPVNTSYLGTPIIMLIINLLCLDIIMKAYNAENATTSMFVVATYLSLGSMAEYAFILMMIVYPIMALMAKILRIKEIIAFIMGLAAPYWVALGLGLVSFSDFRIPRFLVNLPNANENYLMLVFASLGCLALIGIIMTLNNAMLIYAGNMRERTFNNMINLLAFACGIFMIIDFDNFGAYASSFCFAVSVQISNFFVMRRIPESPVWFWGLLSLFIAFFFFMLIDSFIG
ncbi:MAG: hypothetical protein K2G85_06815 [Muribaculaceae bacterium]|nr:hypothetical protein [Muribaculaceae bacterium]